MTTLEIIMLIVWLFVIGAITEIIFLTRKFLLERIKKVPYLYSDNSWSAGRWNHWKYIDSDLIKIIKCRKSKCLTVIGNGIKELPNRYTVLLEKKELFEIYDQEEQNYPFLVFKLKHSKKILIRYFESISKNGLRVFYLDDDKEIWEEWEENDIEILGTISNICIEEE